jgi:outer membrane lipoprotein SlyB
MNVRILFPAAACLLVLAGCSKTPSNTGAHATITLRDGKTISGTVQSTSATQMQVTGDDGVVQTIPMSQVRGVEYADAEPTAGTPPAGGPADAPDPVHEHHYHPDPAAVTTKTFVVPAGTQVSVRTEETIDSGHAAEGQTYAGEVTKDVRDSDGNCVIPRGANAQLRIISASKGGHFRGASDLVLDLASVSVGGQSYRVQSTSVGERGHSGVGANKRTAEFAGGGGAFGAIVGAIAGGGKGAAIGAGAGAGAGALTEILTKGTIKVPVESVLTFRLEAPLSVEAVQ